MNWLSTSFASLRHRNFRLLWLGQLISTAGSMMQNAAVLWHVSLVVPEDKKGLALGLVGLVKIVPVIAFSLLGGVIADAYDRRKVMLVAQLFMTVVAATLAWLTFGGLSTAWPIYLLTAMSSAGSALDGPARQSLVPALVPARDFPNAISLNTIMFQIASVAGPGLAGLVIDSYDIGWVYAINAVSFLAVVVGLLAMRDVPEASPDKRGTVSLAAAAEGLRHVFATPIIRSTMLLDFMVTFCSSATGLLPIFTQDILKLDARAYGRLMAAPSVGALAASLVMIHVAPRIQRRGRVFLWSIGAYSAATILFGVSRDFASMFVALAAIGAADTVSTVIRNVVRQLATPDHLRGRMTSVNMIFFLGGPQLGELEAGLVAQWFGAPLSVVSGGVASLLATVWVSSTNPWLRRYEREDDARAETA